MYAKVFVTKAITLQSLLVEGPMNRGVRSLPEIGNFEGGNKLK